MTTELRGSELAHAVWEKINSIPAVRGFPTLANGDFWQQNIYVNRLTDKYGVACGTAACFAGWACILVDGHKADRRHHDYKDDYHVETRARELLDLDSDGVCDLFDCDNTLEEIHESLEDIYGQEFRPVGRQ